jgi:hypothetical protein
LLVTIVANVYRERQALTQAAFVALAEDLEQQFGSRRRQRHIAKLVDDQQLVAGELALQAQQPFFVPRLDQFVDKSRRRDEADRQALLTNRQAEPERDMTFARAARNSVTMPGVRCSRYGSTIRSIHDMARWCRSCFDDGLQVRITWPYSSRTARWLWSRAGWRKRRPALSLSPLALGYLSIGSSSCALALMRF